MRHYTWEALEKSSEEYPNWVQQAFQMLDKDGNGTIDAGEVAELVFMNEDEGVLTAEAKKVVANCISEVGRVQVDLVWLTHHVA